VPKDALRIEAYGTVDELNSVIGCVRAEHPDPEIDEILEEVQHDLFELGADLATPRSVEKSRVKRVEGKDVQRLERAIDRVEGTLKPLRSFVLPGGSVAAARLHLARTVCRRAERIVVRLSRNEDIGESMIVYLNRLSDLLFVLARAANHRSGVLEVRWRG
jgi:cob(I)alamin adenosyltransferase